jgi:hypothetical protein
MTKDDSKPKRPMNAYFRFKADNIERIQKANPTVAYIALSTFIGEEYKNISQKDKDRYEAAIKKETEKYNKDLAAYKAANPADQKKKVSESDKKKSTDNKAKDKKNGAKASETGSTRSKSGDKKGDRSKSKGKVLPHDSKNDKKGKSVDKKDDGKNAKKSDSKNVAKVNKDGVAKKKKE